MIKEFESNLDNSSLTEKKIDHASEMVISVIYCSRNKKKLIQLILRVENLLQVNLTFLHFVSKIEAITELLSRVRKKTITLPPAELLLLSIVKLQRI